MSQHVEPAAGENGAQANQVRMSTIMTARGALKGKGKIILLH